MSVPTLLIVEDDEATRDPCDASVAEVPESYNPKANTLRGPNPLNVPLPQ